MKTNEETNSSSSGGSCNRVDCGCTDKMSQRIQHPMVEEKVIVKKGDVE